MPDGESDGTRDTEQVGEVAHQLVVVKFLQVSSMSCTSVISMLISLL